MHVIKMATTVSTSIVPDNKGTRCTLELLISHCHNAIAGRGHGVINLREMYINRLSCLPNMLQRRLAGIGSAKKHPAASKRAA